MMESFLDDVLLGRLAKDEILEHLNFIMETNTSVLEKSRFANIQRLCNALIEADKNESSWLDVAILLRQVMLVFKCRLTVEYEWAQKIIDVIYFSGLNYYEAGNFIEFEAIDNPDSELNETFTLIYDYEKRAVRDGVIGDGYLQSITEYQSYTSFAQKAAVFSALRQPGGTTMLVSLPTGGGKSLIFQILTFLNTDKTTIVIEPTIALALDQEYAARVLAEKNNFSVMPAAYYSGLQTSQKNQMICDIREGKIPLLFISPEALLQTEFNAAAMESARAGKLECLVIDEAHIVKDWGALFRPEFQILAPFRKKLLEASVFQLKTMFLSATIEEDTSSLLRNIFKTDHDQWLEIRGDTIRPEIIFHIKSLKTAFGREQYILKMLPFLPRPIILYVHAIEKANHWRDLIKSAGYCRVEVFTGETTREERKEILSRWNNNEIDIMIANSAFGMGVDKPDIRTIIHAYIPNNLSRFYQEVGRAGRDGFPALSLWVPVLEEDKDETWQMKNNAVMKESTMLKRWESLWEQQIDHVGSDTFWADMGSRAEYLKYEQTGNQNKNWNENLILFMVRHGFIELRDLKFEEQSFKVLIKILDVNLVTDIDLFLDKIKQVRDKERAVLDNEVHQVINLIKNPNKRCWANLFKEIYPFAEGECGGCPACREIGFGFSKFHTEHVKLCGTDLLVETCGESGLSGIFTHSLDFYQETLITVPDTWTDFNAEYWLQFLQSSAYLGVPAVIYPTHNVNNTKTLFEAVGPQPTMIIDIDTVKIYRGEFPVGSVMLIYPDKPEKSKQYYSWAVQYINKNRKNRVIHVAREGLTIGNMGRLLEQIVEGKIFRINSAEEMVQ